MTEPTQEAREVAREAFLSFGCQADGQNAAAIIQAALDKARADERASKWQPIETAPKRGEVLIFCEETSEMFVAFWGTDPEDGDQQWVFARSPQVSFIVRDPTHWMPLPGAPASKEIG